MTGCSGCGYLQGIIQWRRNNLFKRAKNSPKDKDRYKRARNWVVSQLCNGKGILSVK